MIIETIFELYALGMVRVRVLGFGFRVSGFRLGLRFQVRDGFRVRD